MLPKGWVFTQLGWRGRTEDDLNILTLMLLPALSLHWETHPLATKCPFMGLLHMHVSSWVPPSLWWPNLCGTIAGSSETHPQEGHTTLKRFQVLFTHICCPLCCRLSASLSRLSLQLLNFDMSFWVKGQY